MFGAKVEIAAREKAINFELVMVPFDPARGYEPKHTDVLRINPKRQVPVLIDGNLDLFDSTQIFEYLEDLKKKIALFCNMPESHVISMRDMDTIYSVPVALADEGLDNEIVRILHLQTKERDMSAWLELLDPNP